ncbi:hypothetical protein NKH95_10940 [Mesorhizobium sp. M0848]|uniref:hypothetical protein n=1 Tax=Mesorhizobium sp. M0848 TaxID=2957012 RepID=UPI0033352E49
MDHFVSELETARATAATFYAEAQFVKLLGQAEALPVAPSSVAALNQLMRSREQARSLSRQVRDSQVSNRLELVIKEKLRAIEAAGTQPTLPEATNSDFASSASAVSAESNVLPYGPKAGMTITITGRSSLNTDHAEITLDNVAANAKGFCANSNGETGEACAKDSLAGAKIQSSVVANCGTGKFTGPWGNGFQFVGRSAEEGYPYAVMPDVIPHEVLDYKANYDVAVETFKALCPTRVKQADRDGPVAEESSEVGPDDETSPDLTDDDAGSEVALSGSSFRGLQLGMTTAQLTQSLDRSFALTSKWAGTELQAFAALAEGMNSGIPTSQTLFIVKGPQACGQIVMRDGVAARLRFYQCYFDIGDGMSIGDFAQQIAETYQLEDGMSGHWEMRGDGAYRFKYTEYVGVRQTTSERFTASLHQMDNNLTLTVERVPHANFN